MFPQKQKTNYKQCQEDRIEIIHLKGKSKKKKKNFLNADMKNTLLCQMYKLVTVPQEHIYNLRRKKAIAL